MTRAASRAIRRRAIALIGGGRSAAGRALHPRQRGGARAIPSLLLVLAFTGGARADGPVETMATCAAEVRARPDDRAAYGCYYRVARATGDFAGARERLAAHLRDDPSNPWARMVVGNLEADRDSAAAARHYRAAIAELERRGQDGDSVLARLNLAMQVVRGGDLEAAERELERAGEVAERDGAAGAKALVALERARLVIRRGGALGAAERMLDAAADELLARGPYQARLNYFQARASIASQRDQLDAAIAFTERGLAAAREQGDRYGAVALAHNLLQLRMDAAPTRPAIDLAELRAEADALLAAAREADHPTAVTSALCLRGELSAAAGALAAGEDDLRACMARAREEDDLHRVAVYAATLAAFLRDRGRADEADALLAEARRLARESRAPRAELQVALTEAHIGWRHEPLPVARARALALLATLEAQTAGEVAPADRIPRFGGFTDVYRRYAGELLRHPAREPADRELAFALGERMRAYSLRERLAAAAPGPDAPLAPVTLARARALLGPGEALLVYQLAGDLDLYGEFAGGSWLWVLTRARVELVRLPPRARLAGRILGFSGSFAARDGSEEAAGAALYRELLAPALARLDDGAHTLIIAPDQELHALAFAALRPAPGEPPLATERVVAVVPSVTAWARWREPATARPEAALGLPAPSTGEFAHTAGPDEPGDPGAPGLPGPSPRDSASGEPAQPSAPALPGPSPRDSAPLAGSGEPGRPSAALRGTNESPAPGSPAPSPGDPAPPAVSGEPDQPSAARRGAGEPSTAGPSVPSTRDFAHFAEPGEPPGPLAAPLPGDSAPPAAPDDPLADSPPRDLTPRAPSAAAPPRVVGFADPPPGDTGLPALPGARAELAAMAAALSGRADVVLHHGEDASEAALRRELRGAALVHVAAHTRVDVAAPARTAVLLADGALTSAEVLGLDATGAWIVLAACSADSGPLVPGEGLDGLAQAWFRAGARGVIATAWPVRDDEARLVFAEFYRALADGDAVGPALARAQRAAIAAGLPAEAWAGVRVLGDPAARPLALLPAPASSSLVLGWFVAAGVALSALALAVARRRVSRKN